MNKATAIQADRLRSTPAATRALLWTGIVLGMGTAGALDEIILHQLLQWHNFYVHTTLSGRIISDGLFHLLSFALLMTGALRLWQQRQRISQLGSARPLLAGVLMGAGGFNLYDGTIQHKLLRLHPVREGVANQLPYDIAFNSIALLVLLLGWLLWRRARAIA
jgi:uncharacterized membrane protein